MVHDSGESIDPRIRRTRLLLQQALQQLLKTQAFDAISVQDITQAATLNRATFYDHYADKFELLECMVGCRFHELLTSRNVQFDGTCAPALKGLVLAVCEYLTQVQGSDCSRQIEPRMESAVITIVRRMILEGLKSHPPDKAIAPALRAAVISWAIYGAAREWVQTPDRCPVENVADTVVTLVAPILPPACGGPQPPDCGAKGQKKSRNPAKAPRAT
jgi:AcrR family transcriptional regulator